MIPARTYVAALRGEYVKTVTPNRGNTFTAKQNIHTNKQKTHAYFGARRAGAQATSK